MSETAVIGIDCGGTHTDAALLSVPARGEPARLLASAKTVTRADNLALSIAEALAELAAKSPANALSRAKRATLGATLAINALVQNKLDKVGLALSAGPGLDPLHFALGDHVCVVPGGLDHRGREASELFLDVLAEDAARWKEAGVRAAACVGKFSPRNPAHENAMAATVAKTTGLPVTLGHKISGKLNFPRRVATAYYGAAVSRLHGEFLDSAEKAFADAGLTPALRLLKADGGAISFPLSRKEPARSILSGPAASVMGALALWDNAGEGCSLLLDMGGTTSDLALFINGSPALDRNGMTLNGRRTLVRSLASVSIGVGGDSRVRANLENGSLVVATGPDREGPAMAFGGEKPTLMDALNFLDGTNAGDRGDEAKSRAGLERLAANLGVSAAVVAKAAVGDAMNKIAKAAYDLVENVNSRPIYTLSGLKDAKQARPAKLCLVGGPAPHIAERVGAAIGLSAEVAPEPEVANAVGAALTLPTATLEVYADTGKGELYAPALDYSERIPKNYTLEQTREKALELLNRKLRAEDMSEASAEVIEADIFATLDDYGRGSRDMRVTCQARPGIIARARP